MYLQRATAVCVMLLTAVNAVAQQPSVSAAAGTFTVIGDVDRPGNFRFDQPLTVRAAVSSASPVGDAVNVTVLRNGHDRAQSTRLLRLSAADSGEEALSGDLYVVESLAQPSRPVLPNAVLRGPAGTTVISLEDAGVVIGDVLQGLGMPVKGEIRVAVPCRIHGQRSLESAPLSASVRHGDVITVSGAALSPEGAAAIRPMVSEWRGSSGRVADQQQSSLRTSVGGKQEVRLPELPAPLPTQPPVARPAASAAVPVAPATAASASPAVKPVRIPQGSPSEGQAPSTVTPQLPELSESSAQAPSAAESRVVIVGDRTQGSRRVTSVPDDVLMLGESLRVPTPAPVGVGQPPQVAPPYRDRVASKTVTEGRNVSGKGLKVPVTAAVSTKQENVTPTDATDVRGPDSQPKEATAGSSSTVHWTVIVGLFVAGVWVLGRSLFVGSAAAGNVNTGSMSTATPSPATSAAEAVPAASSNLAPGTGAGDTPWRIYSVPQAIRPAKVSDGRSKTEDELDLLIANQLPIERTTPMLPQGIELSGRSSSAGGQTIRRVDGPHAVLRGRHVEQSDPNARRGRPLGERLSQLIRTVPAGSPGAFDGSGRATGSSGAER